MQFEFVKIHPDAITPQRGTPNSAAYDLFSIEEKQILPQTAVSFSTGIKISIADGYAGIVYSRSGLSFKYNIERGAGLIDSDYLGEIKCILYNHHKTESKLITKGERICQIAFQKVEFPELIQVKDFSEKIKEMKATRGENGFGSTGTHSIKKKQKMTIKKQNIKNE